MPWYLRQLSETCQECGKTATHSLHNPKNALWGHFCWKCGKKRLDEANNPVEIPPRRPREDRE